MGGRDRPGRVRVRADPRCGPHRPGRGAATGRPRIAGLAARDDWYFVGRRREQRHWQADLTGPDLAGIVVHEIGGTGKTTLAAEITTRLLDRDPGWVLVSLAGALALEGLLGEVTSVIRRELLVRGLQDSKAIRALDVAARANVGLAGSAGDPARITSWTMCRCCCCWTTSKTTCAPGGTGYAVRDQVLAGLLAAWVTDPGAVPAAGHLPASVHPARWGGTGVVVPAAGGAVAGRDD